jgi:hypothetical protein
MIQYLQHYKRLNIFCNKIDIFNPNVKAVLIVNIARTNSYFLHFVFGPSTDSGGRFDCI